MHKIWYLLVALVVMTTLVFTFYVFSNRNASITNQSLDDEVSYEAGSNSNPKQRTDVLEVNTSSKTSSIKEENKTLPDNSSNNTINPQVREKIQNEIELITARIDLSETQRKEMENILTDFRSASTDESIVGHEEKFMSEIENKLKDILTEEQLKKLRVIKNK